MSGTPLSQPLPLRRNPKLRQAGSTPKHSRPATQVWSAGACALATALDDACSGTRPPSRSYEFPLRRDPQSSGKPEALQNTAAPPPKFGVLALARLRPLWITHAREHVLPAALTCSRTDAIQSSGKPEALQNPAASPPKFGVLALARLRPLWMTHAREHVLLAALTSSRTDAIQSSGKPEALQNLTVPPPKFGVLALARLRPLWMT